MQGYRYSASHQVEMLQHKNQCRKKNLIQSFKFITNDFYSFMETDTILIFLSVDLIRYLHYIGLICSYVKCVLSMCICYLLVWTLWGGTSSETPCHTRIACKYKLWCMYLSFHTNYKKCYFIIDLLANFKAAPAKFRVLSDCYFCSFC